MHLASTISARSCLSIRARTTPGYGTSVLSAEPPQNAGFLANSTSFTTVFQLRAVLVVSSRESKYWGVSLLCATPFGHRR